MAYTWFMYVVPAILFCSITTAQPISECFKRQIASDNGAFMDETGVKHNCTPDGFVYESRHCGCTSLIGGSPITGRKADVNITFGEGKVADVDNRIWVNNTGINVSTEFIQGSVDGYVGVFAGGQLEIPFFNDTELGAQLRIEIRFRETDFNNVRTTALISNCDSLSAGSLFIGLVTMDPISSKSRLFLDTSVPTVLEISNPVGWKTLILDYDAINKSPSLELSVKSEDGTVTSVTGSTTGNILVQKHPLIIGAASSGQVPFMGYIDHIYIWKV